MFIILVQSLTGTIDSALDCLCSCYYWKTSVWFCRKLNVAFRNLKWTLRCASHTFFSCLSLAFGFLSRRSQFPFDTEAFLPTLSLSCSFWLKIRLWFCEGLIQPLTDDLLKSLQNRLPVARATPARFCFLCRHVTGCWRHRGRDAVRVWSTLGCTGLRRILGTCWIDTIGFIFTGLYLLSVIIRWKEAGDGLLKAVIRRG